MTPMHPSGDRPSTYDSYASLWLQVERLQASCDERVNRAESELSESKATLEAVITGGTRIGPRPPAPLRPSASALASRAPPVYHG